MNDLRTPSIFQDIRFELGDVLDLNPAGITQESSWLHFKTKGIKVSVDQLRNVLDKMTTAGELVSQKDKRNQTVWKRAARGGFVTAKPDTLLGEKPSEQTVSREHASLFRYAENPPEKLREAMPPELAPIVQQMDEVQALRKIDALTPAAMTAAIGAAHVLPQPLEAAMTSAVDSPAPARRFRAPGELDTLILNALANGPMRASIIERTTQLNPGTLYGALKRLIDLRKVQQLPNRSYCLADPNEPPKPAPARLAPKAKKARPTPKTPSKVKPETAAEPEADPTPDLDPSVAQFVARLQPVERLPQKIQALDQLITVMPAPIAEHLRAIRADFVRLAGA